MIALREVKLQKLKKQKTKNKKGKVTFANSRALLSNSNSGRKKLIKYTVIYMVREVPKLSILKRKSICYLHSIGALIKRGGLGIL